MKLRSGPMIGCVAVMFTLADSGFDCKDIAASSLLDVFWYAAATRITQNLDNQSGQTNPDDGQSGQGNPGAPGLSCWDLNGNGQADPEEDINGDGNFNALDCQGAQGPAGQDGAPGQNGQNGQNGANGQNGVSCWDTNGNGQADPQEDINGDGNFDALDCQGAAGQNGQDGQNGANGQNGQDGQNGADGQDGQDGADGQDGQNGADGQNGTSCWDLNGNGVADPEEDVNDDGVVNALDCQGAPGQNGQDGAPGQNGVACWDLNGDGIGQAEEDRNGDGDFNALDCQGAQGPPGVSCWDLNANGIGDKGEDTNGDGNFDALDCQGPPGPPGAPGEDGLDLTGVIGRGVIRADGTTESGGAILNSSLDQIGVYTIAVSLANATQIPPSKDDFPILLTVEANLSDAGGGGAPLPLMAYYLPIELQPDRLIVRVFVRNIRTNQPNNSSFSIVVLEP